jgi:transcriptional regulator with GAF, ATPase, and Fis domain
MIHISREAVLELHAEYKNAQTVAAKLGCCPDSVYKILRANGIRSRVAKPRLEDARIIKLLEAVGTASKVAQIVGCAVPTITRRLKKLGIPLRYGRPAKAKFSPRMVEAVLRRLNGDVKKAAEELGCCETTVKIYIYERFCEIERKKERSVSWPAEAQKERLGVVPR